ncbi:hypothetical protein [Clostridium sp. D46t1_190503_E9]|uniref:hypothetical protein n=1 Tax=Clostridium sp. D46t1_190503_E9 TaxID=2787137 RepID=UPI00189B1B62|nr:hypothetical protein [Clostridium sp. D46t1_190503_E9]
MKKFISILLLCLSLSCIPTNAIIQFAESQLKEGVYRVNTFTTPLNEINYIENTSKTNDVYFVVFNENDTLMQSIKLPSSSSKYKILQLEPSYKIVIIGKGSILLSKE